MSDKFFYENRITQSDYRGGATNEPRKHPLYLDSKLPKVKFKTKKGKATFLNNLDEYVAHFITVLLGEDNTKGIKEKVVNLIKKNLGIASDE